MNYTVIQKSLSHKLTYKKEILRIIRSDKKIYLLILGIFLVVLTVMLPFKDQLFSEDFAYAQSVRHFITTGDLKISERVAPSGITLIVWGAIFTKIFGFSLANLHLSVVILIPFLLIALYKLFILAGCSKQKSLIFTLFFLSIPWILQLSYTFLTDIPFLAIEIFALLFYLQGFKKDKPMNFLLGSIFASLAFLTRQLGIVFAFAAFVTVLFSKNGARQKIKNTLASLLIPLLVSFLYVRWLGFPGNKTIAQYAIDQEMKKTISYLLPFTNISIENRIENYSSFVHVFLKFTSEALVILFPIVALLLLTNLKRLLGIVNKNWLAFICMTAIAALIYIFDIIKFRKDYTFGFPLLIYEYESLLPIPWAHIWKYIVLINLPILSCTIYFQYKNLLKFNNYQRFIFLSFIFMVVPIVIFVASWEVYIIPFLPLLMLWIASLTKKFTLNTKLSIVVVSILLLDSVQMTKLRYSESGVIWGKAMKLVNSGISPIEIDPSNNYGWYYWFYFEKLASDSIKSNGGNKENLNFGFIIEKPDLPKHRIYSERMIHYTNMDTTNYKVEIVPVKSLFVNSKIYFMQLNER